MLAKKSFFVKFKLLAFLMYYAAKVMAQSPYDLSTAGQGSINGRPATGFLKMGTSTSPTGDSFSYNTAYLTKNGQPWYPVMGELHFSRIPRAQWEPEILQMKTAGIQVISTYIIWNHHERVEGAFNWKGNKDLRQFIALCKKHHMYVWLRPGPWVHAEVRSGGFPDWLVQANLKLRSTDPAFMRYVGSFFQQIGRQCAGYLFKDGGPIIGVQIENELVFTRPAAYGYMKALKQLAIRSGMDVPYYAAFAQGPDNQDEFLYMMGSYPDSPWNTSTKKLYKPIFFIKPLEADQDIGSDLFGAVNKKVRNTYPKLSAEIGAGMQVTYHRRTQVSPKDVGANLLTKIASGLNGVGYYMYHGGVNPVGATSMQESRQSGYPNDVPLINYDFQAPIGAMGNYQQSFGELHLLNMFLNDFGSLVATMSPSFPSTRKIRLQSTDTVQCSIRSKDGKGFLFLSNYQRYVHMPAVSSFQLKITGDKGTEAIPVKPVTFKADAYAIWPFHLAMEGIVLNYSTAQPLCILHNKAETTYVFFGDTGTSFCLQEKTYKNYQLRENCQMGDDKNTVVCTEGKTAFFDLESAEGKLVHVLVLPRQLALQSYKFKNAGKELLLVTKGEAFQNQNILHIKNPDPDASGVPFMIYPNATLQLQSSQAKLSVKQANFPLRSYQLAPLAPVKGKITMTAQTLEPRVTIAANAYADSVIRILESGKSYKSSQRGPLYQIAFHDLPDQQKYQLRYELPLNPLVQDWRLQFVYQADVLAIYAKNKLVYDQFNYNDSCLFSPTYLLNQHKGALGIQLLPGYKDMDVFWEDAFKKSNPIVGKPPSIQNISLMPVYDYALEFR